MVICYHVSMFQVQHWNVEKGKKGESMFTILPPLCSVCSKLSLHSLHLRLTRSNKLIEEKSKSSKGKADTNLKLITLFSWRNWYLGTGRSDIQWESWPEINRTYCLFPCNFFSLISESEREVELGPKFLNTWLIFSFMRSGYFFIVNDFP